MNPRQLTADDLVRVICGDAQRIGLLVDQADVARVAAGIPERQRTLTPIAVKVVLTALLHREVTPEQAQAWASFVRRGFIPVSAKDQSVPQIYIAYQEDHLDSIVDAVARLDELGDIIDGTISDSELQSLIGSL